MKKIIQLFNSNKSLKNLVVYGVGQAFNLITPLLVIPYIVAICGEEGYGKISVGMALSFFLIVFIDYGSDIVGVKEVAVYREDRDKLEQIFVTTYSAKMVLLLAVVFAASMVFYFVPYFSNEKTLFFLSLPILLGQLINPTWFLQGVENFKWITILNVISKVIYVVGIYVLIKHDSDYVYNNLVWGIGMIVAHGIAFGYLLHTYSFSFKTVNREAVFALIRGNFSMFSSQIFVSLQMYAPVVLISFFGNNTMAGQFKIVDQVIVIFKTYILLFFNYAYPRVCYLLEKSVNEGLRFWKTYNGANAIFILVSMGGIFIFSDAIVSYFNPKEIATISALLRIAVLIPILQSIGIPLKQLVIGFNKQKEYVRLTMVTTVVSLVMIVIATPLFKIEGVIFTLIFTELLIIALFFNTIKNNLFPRSS